MLNVLSLQTLKRTGLAKIKQMFLAEPDIIIQDHGKDTCVLVDLDYYGYLRSCELEIALIKAKKEIANGQYTTNVEQHIKCIEKVLK